MSVDKRKEMVTKRERLKRNVGSVKLTTEAKKLRLEKRKSNT